MMLKRITSFRTATITSFLTAGSPSVNKVIHRSSSGYEVVGKWDLLSAVCLERHPIITKPMEELEATYQNMLRQVEFENSLMSDFELRVEKEKKSKPTTKDDEEVILSQTTQDFEDSCEEELRKFKFAPRISESNAVESLKRKLDKNLVLLVKQKVGNVDFWLPPQSVRKHEETMIQTAHRTLQEFCGNNIRVQFYGKAPIGFYKYKYPRSLQKEQDGAKVFFFLAKYLSGDVSSNVKYCWLDRQEMKDTLNPDLCKSLSRFLLPD